MYKFSIGDRVQVAESWFVEELRGLQGKIATYPDGIAGHLNACVAWVEFDEVWPTDSPLHRVDAAEIQFEHLILISQLA